MAASLASVRPYGGFQLQSSSSLASPPINRTPIFWNSLEIRRHGRIAIFAEDPTKKKKRTSAGPRQVVPTSEEFSRNEVLHAISADRNSSHHRAEEGWQDKSGIEELLHQPRMSNDMGRMNSPPSPSTSSGEHASEGHRGRSPLGGKRDERRVVQRSSHAMALGGGEGRHQDSIPESQSTSAWGKRLKSTTVPALLALSVSYMDMSSALAVVPISQLRRIGLVEAAAGKVVGKVVENVDLPETAEAVGSGFNLLEVAGVANEVAEPLEVASIWLQARAADVPAEAKVALSTVWEFATGAANNPSSFLDNFGFVVLAVWSWIAERVAAVELSALLAAGARLLLLGPLFVVVPGAILKVFSNGRQPAVNEDSLERLTGSETAAAKAKAETVRRALQRMELKSHLLTAVDRLGEEALLSGARGWRHGGVEEVEELLERLQLLSPAEDPTAVVAPSVTPAVPDEEGSGIPTSATIDGDWKLIYVSKSSVEDTSPEGLTRALGFEVFDIRQSIGRGRSTAAAGRAVMGVEGAAPDLTARNTAELRIGGLGRVQVAVQGKWVPHKNGSRTMVSFDSFSARPLEVFGRPVDQQLPALTMALPRPLQQSTNWDTPYLDDDIRINVGQRGITYLFKKVV